MSNASGFLARVAAAVRAGNRYRETTRATIEPGVGYLGAGPDPVSRFMDELRGVGASADSIGSLGQLETAVRELVARFSVRYALLNSSPLLDRLNLRDLLRGCGTESVTTDELASCDEPVRRERLFAADLGVAVPDWAIAESGTLVYASSPQQTRSATLLPPVHLAIVERASILADLFDLPERLAERSTDGVLPRNVALVTGPSKTGDIELRLTTGVHGPGHVHVLVWET